MNTGPGFEFRSDDRQVPRGAAVSGCPRQAGDCARLRQADDRGGTGAARSHRGRPRAERRARASGHGSKGQSAARAAEGHADLQRHRHAVAHSDLRPARERGSRHGGGQPIGSHPGAARWPRAHRVASAGAHRVHGEGRGALRAPARARLQHLGVAAHDRHAQRLADRARAAGGRSARARTARAAVQHLALVRLRAPEAACAAGWWTDMCSCAAAVWRACAVPARAMCGSAAPPPAFRT